MKIWILNHYAISPNFAGGTRHFDFAKELVNKGHEVTIFASSFNHFSRTETINYETNSYFKVVNEQGVNFVWIKTPAYFNSIKRIINMLAFSFKLNSCLKHRLITEKPDLIIGSSVHPLTPLVGLRVAKMNSIPFYFEERDLWPQTFVDFGKMTKKNILFRILLAIEKKLYRESDKIIFLFENAYRYAEQFDVKKDKIIYLPNGFDSRRVDNEGYNEKLNELLSQYLNKKLCVYVGSMGIANDVDKLVLLAEKMKYDKDYHFLFFGDGPLKEQLIQDIRDKNIENITFFDPVPKNDVLYILKQAHCGLLSIKNSPLYKWGMSMNKIYDYLSVGLPIITYTDLESLGEVESTGGIYKSSDIDNLRELVININTEEREKIKIKAFEKFSWKMLTQNFLKELESTDFNEKRIGK
ncbi:glycosyltransferase family 4 protein [Metasolibacillus sp.]|uniref:glycosyltransferase family 4 protein n=1 Tax=Metasolibacillus sp. TaxID=2703680 RepID=UPI0025E09135|nr:glycosyltransferase family 4 protein [Metasolibacillus sp.]MCT6923378.1 glycosyltransferase family 4 protein [Metasolibacillus sp.]MCT6939899.1 glycosyltransferase family 4 protein [Metasolibacillus sp.]